MLVMIIARKNNLPSVIEADGLLNFGLRTLGMASGGGIFSSSSDFYKYE